MKLDDIVGGIQVVQWWIFVNMIMNSVLVRDANRWNIWASQLLNKSAKLGLIIVKLIEANWKFRMIPLALLSTAL